MSSIMLFEEWNNFNSKVDDVSFENFDAFKNISESYKRAWHQTGKPWLNSLYESVMPHFSIDEFRNEVLPHLNESHDYDEIKEAYAIYELSLLDTHRPDWFLDDNKIIALPNYDEHKVILSKNESLFIISMSTWSAILESNWLSKTWGKAKELAGKAWDFLKDGAQKVWAFLVKIGTAAWEYTKNNPLEVIAITLNIFGGIMAFVPAVGQIVAPIATMLSGATEVVAGYLKLDRGMEYLSKITDPFVKSLASAKDAIPWLLAGGVTTLLGAADMITAVKDATPGMLGIKLSTKQAAETLSKEFSQTLIGSLEHGLKDAVTEFATKYLSKTSVQSVKLASTSATALLCILLVKGGKGILGGTMDGIVNGISSIGPAFDYLTNIPQKISDTVSKISSVAKGNSYVAKVVSGGLDKVVQPMTKSIQNFVDGSIKPIVKPVTSYLNLLPSNYQNALEIIDKHVKSLKDQPIKIDHKTVKPENVNISQEEKSKLKELTKKDSKILTYNDWSRK